MVVDLVHSDARMHPWYMIANNARKRDRSKALSKIKGTTLMRVRKIEDVIGDSLRLGRCVLVSAANSFDVKKPSVGSCRSLILKTKAIAEM